MHPPYRADLHCHTTASFDGRVDPLRLVELARERGLTHVAITDHETIDGALAAREAGLERIVVIVGEEVRTTEGDLIVLFVSKPIPGGLSVEETIRLARAQDCVIGLPHPFDAYRPSIGIGADRPDALRRLAALADYVEVHNGRVREERSNSRAADLGRQFGLSQVAVSDAHAEAEIGGCYTELSSPFVSAPELRAALTDVSLRVRREDAQRPTLFDRVGLRRRERR